MGAEGKTGRADLWSIWCSNDLLLEKCNPKGLTSSITCFVTVTHTYMDTHATHTGQGRNTCCERGLKGSTLLSSKGAGGKEPKIPPPTHTQEMSAHTPGVGCSPQPHFYSFLRLLRHNLARATHNTPSSDLLPCCLKASGLTWGIFMVLKPDCCVNNIPDCVCVCVCVCVKEPGFSISVFVFFIHGWKVLIMRRTKYNVGTIWSWWLGNWELN